MTPLISFIITYHNEPEAFLLACIESIQALHLTEDEAEVIVVDDGSDKSLEVDCQYVRQEPAGLSVARNTGIEHAKGRYIQFVDADDLLTPAYTAVLEQLREQKSDIILFRMTKASSNSPFGGGVNPSWRAHVKAPPKRGSWEGAYFLQHRNLRAAACGYTFKREILGDLRFHPGLLHEDELFTPQLFLKAGTLVELDAKAYFYRQHEGTITHSRTAEQVQNRLNDIHFIINEIRCLNNPVLERRIHQLIVDYLQKVWVLTHSFSALRCRIRELRGESLMPLPLHRYSLRYLLLAPVANLL